jgi:ribosomal-protein-alanine N-acetyltransferase
MFIISKMSGADVASVAAIEWAHQREPWSESAFREELDKLHSLCFVARIDGDPEEAPFLKGTHGESAIAGYVCAWIVLDEIQILNVTVRRSCRRQGIGRALLRHALQCGWSRGCTRALLEVRPSNTAARRLYESAGFRAVGERPNFYADGKEAAILMELEKCE